MDLSGQDSGQRSVYEPSEPLPSYTVKQISSIMVIGKVKNFGFADKLISLHSPPKPAFEAVISVVPHDEVGIIEDLSNHEYISIRDSGPEFRVQEEVNHEKSVCFWCVAGIFSGSWLNYG